MCVKINHEWSSLYIANSKVVVTSNIAIESNEQNDV